MRGIMSLPCQLYALWIQVVTSEWVLERYAVTTHKDSGGRGGREQFQGGAIIKIHPIIIT